MSTNNFNETEIDLARLMKADAINLFEKRNQQIRKMREWRYGENTSDIPAGYKSTAKFINVPLAADVIDRCTAIVNESRINIIVPPSEPGITAKRNSTKREKWLKALLKKMESDLGRHVTNLATECQMADGIGVVKVIYTPESWKAMPSTKSIFGSNKKIQDLNTDEAKKLSDTQEKAKKSFGLPVSIIDVDPLTYYPFTDDMGALECVIEISRRPMRATQAKYANELEGKLSNVGLGQGEYEKEVLPMVEVWECWTRDWYTLFVDDTPVMQRKNKMGRPPYFECVAKERSSRDPARALKPPVYDLIDLIESIQNFLTMGQNVMYLFAYPTPITTTPANVEIAKSGDLKPKAVKFEVGKHHVLFQGQELKFLTPPVEHIKVMEQWIDRLWKMFETLSGLGPALKGIGGADQPGYAINQLIQASMLTIRPAVDSKIFMMQQMMAFILDLVENVIADTVWVHGESPKSKTKDEDRKRGKHEWIGLGPSDIDGYYEIEIEIDPMVDAQRIAKGSFGADMHERGLLDAQTVIEDFIGYPNPEEILDNLWVEKAISEGPLAEKVMQDAVTRAGIAVANPQQQNQPTPDPSQMQLVPANTQVQQPNQPQQNVDTANAMIQNGNPAPSANQGQTQPQSELTSSFK